MIPGSPASTPSPTRTSRPGSRLASARLTQPVPPVTADQVYSALSKIDGGMNLLHNDDIMCHHIMISFCSFIGPCCQLHEPLLNRVFLNGNERLAIMRQWYGYDSRQATAAKHCFNRASCKTQCIIFQQAQIYRERRVDTNVRWLAIITLKNAVERHWRRTSR